MEAEVAQEPGDWLADDHMIEEVDFQHPRACRNSLCHSHIPSRGMHGARGVVMHQDKTERRMRD